MKKLLPVFISFLFVQAHAQTFTNSIGGAIPDAGPQVHFDVVVSGLPTVIDTPTFGLQSICLNIIHPTDGNLDAKLQSPDGTIIELFSGDGGTGNSFTNTCFTGTATTHIFNGGAPFSGSYIPLGSMGRFNNGQNPNGTWKLLLQDMAAPDQGTLLNFSLTFGNQPAAAFSFTSSNLPIVIINSYAENIPDNPKITTYVKVIDNGPGVRNYTNQTNYSYEGYMGAELQGYTGIRPIKPNYDIELRDSLGNSRDTTFMNVPRESDWIFKAEYTDGSLVENTLTYHMARKIEPFAPLTRYCEIILNGDYVGLYTLTEKVKRDVDRVNIAKLRPIDTAGNQLTGGYIIEMNINNNPPDWTSNYLPSNWATSQKHVEFKHVYPKTDSIMPQQHDYIHFYTDSFENALNGANFLDSATGYRHFADASSFIDFCIINEFSANYDSYGRSTYMYKDKTPHGDGLMHIGPAWDYDRTYNLGNISGWVYELTHPYWPYPFWWMKFRQDSVYMNQLYCRWNMLRQNTLSLDSFNVMIDSAAAQLIEAAPRNFARFPEIGVTDWPAEITRVKQFISARLLWIDSALYSPYLRIPVINLSDTLLCKGSTINVDNGASQFHYYWNTAATTPAITVLASGHYVVSVQDDYGCSALGQATITVPDIRVSLHDTAVCAGQVINVDNGSGYNYLWSTGATTSSITVLTSGSYTVTAQDIHGCTASVQAVITGSNPQVTLLHDTTVCAGSVINVDDGNPYLYMWSTGASTSAITLLLSGYYAVTIQNNIGCLGTAQAFITVPVIQVSLADTTLCSGSLVNADNGNQYSYLWSTGASTSVITILQSGNYTVTAQDNNGCTASASSIITVSVPQVSLHDTTVCPGSVINVYNGNSYLYSWSTGASTSAITITLAGNYSVTASDTYGCTANAQANITIGAVEVNLHDTTVCNGSVIDINGGNQFNYLWSTGASSSSINIVATGTYSVTVSDTSGCTGMAQAVITVSVPHVNLFDTTVCRGSSIDAYNGNQYSYFWNTGANTSAITVLASGTYSIIVQDAYGCSASAQAVFTVPIPDANFTSTQIFNYNWSFSPANSSNLTYHWDFGDGNTSDSVAPNHIFTTPGTHYITLFVRDSFGCTKSYIGSIQIVISSVHDISAMGFQIYPDPFNEIITIDFGQFSGKNTSVEILNYLGQAVRKKNIPDGVSHYNLETADLLPGVYIFQLLSGDEKLLIRKMVKE